MDTLELSPEFSSFMSPRVNYEAEVNWLIAVKRGPLVEALVLVLSGVLGGLAMLVLACFAAWASYQGLGEVYRSAVALQVIPTKEWGGVGGGIGFGIDAAILLVIGIDMLGVAWLMSRGLGGKSRNERASGPVETVEAKSVNWSRVPQAANHSIDSGLGNPWVRNPRIRRAVLNLIAPVLAICRLAMVLILPLLGATLLGVGVDGLLSFYVFAFHGPRTLEGLVLCAGQVVLGVLGGLFLCLATEWASGLVEVQRYIWCGGLRDDLDS